MKFRLQALQAMREPDELDAPTVLAAPRGWIATFVVLVVLVAGVIWTFAGRLPVEVAGHGMLTHAGGTSPVQSAVSGTVTAVDIASATAISSGVTIAEVTDAEGVVREIRSPLTGRVIDVAVAVGQYVGVAQTVATVERSGSGDDPLVAMVFVPAADAGHVRPGTPVELAVSSAPAAAFGLLLGTVRTVSPYPLTTEAVAALVGGPLAATRYTADGPPVAVVVDLRPDTATVSGYAWTTATGSPAPLGSQTGVDATVRIATRSPFQLFVGR